MHAHSSSENLCRMLSSFICPRHNQYFKKNLLYTFHFTNYSVQILPFLLAHATSTLHFMFTALLVKQNKIRQAIDHQFPNCGTLAHQWVTAQFYDGLRN